VVHHRDVSGVHHLLVRVADHAAHTQHVVQGQSPEPAQCRPVVLVGERAGASGSLSTSPSTQG
jgi:hypothetical protein